MRESVKLILTDNGYSVVEASDGLEALRRLQDNRIDCIITDINMPNLNGIELIRRIRADNSVKTLPILVLTTESEFQMIKKGRDVGATGWVVKPFNEVKLISAVNKVL